MPKPWMMVAVTFVTNFLGIGFGFYSFSIFLKPMSEEFGGGRLGVSMIPLIMGVVGAVITPILGRWVGRGRIRGLMFAGALATAFGLLVASRSTQLWQLVVVFGVLLAFGQNTLYGVLPQALIVNWFHNNPARALGYSLLGASASGMVIPPLTTWLMESGSWRWACEVFGWVSLGAAPLILWLVVPHPPERDRGLEGDGSLAREPEEVVSTRDALGEPMLWILAGTASLSYAGIFAVLTHLVPHLTDLDLTPAQAAWILSSTAVGGALAKLVIGWFTARLGEIVTYQVAFVLLVATTLSLLFELSFSGYLFVAAIFGFAMGSNDLLLAALASKIFGRRSFGPVLGLIMAPALLLGMAGAPIAAWIFDSWGSYDLAWLGFSLGFLAAALLLGRVGSHEIAPSTPLKSSPPSSGE